ncbi:hypothetical protein C5167_002080 [Papaver somniferum]|uniref:Uncharacterized protein n=1 Tax=Papaver somniferum TaxID=3469 RepID=A0A4Y7L0V6_PAPSO|nr:olee1-like protein isoform X1 [Papaver somniferum]RZC77839.1 hypothetical protein C5167_002080 [Papaver somniferum]
MTKVSQLVNLFVVVVICFMSYVYCDDFHVVGQIYCDTCRAGFETEISEPIKGAKVGLECRNKEGGNITYTAEDVVTDEEGMYLVVINGDHEDYICEVLLKESPRYDCNEVVPTRNQGRVAITDNNDIDSPIRFMNSLAFLKKEPLSNFSKVIANLGLTPDDITVL